MAVSGCVNLIPNAFDKFGKVIVNISFSWSMVPNVNTVFPYFTNGASASLKLLQSNPNAQEPIISVVKQAEKNIVIRHENNLQSFSERNRKGSVQQEI